VDGGRRSILAQGDYDEFRVYLYFGPEQDYVLSSVTRAYYDFARTLHGIAKIGNEQVLSLWDAARFGLKGRLAAAAHITDQRTFDAWHRDTCHFLQHEYCAHGYGAFYIGQAQKWVNMALKYIYTLGSRRVPGFEGVYPLCHIPIDNIMLKRLGSERYATTDMPTFSCVWSRIANYEHYLAYQEWARRRFAIPPLDVEFLLWMGKDVPAEYLTAKTAVDVS
jgi:hypothetical protein